MQAALGIVVLIGLAWLLSENRRDVHVRLIFVGLALQFLLAALLLRLEPVRDVLLYANVAIDAIGNATLAGTKFVFGFLGGDVPPFDVTDPRAGYVFAFRVLPQILVWVTITDGPYAGYRGKLVLEDWELVRDSDGTVIGVRFRPTDFRFSEL